jgi:xanthine dehydrogenase molybdenum-binding subunit
MQLAETLGIPYEEVNPIVADTDSSATPTSPAAAGSPSPPAWPRTRRDRYPPPDDRARREALGVRAEERSTIERGVYASNGALERLSFKEIAGSVATTGGPIGGPGDRARRRLANGFGVHIVDVEVDPETGKTTILRYTAVQDVGTAIHPATSRGRSRAAPCRASAGR